MKYIVTNDIHLGHIKTPTSHIINSFKSCILNEKNKDIDVLFIAGDLFDRLLDLNTKEVHYIIEFFNFMLSYCYENNILLRVLEGTPGHDWQQSSILLKLNEIRVNKCNLKYHKVLDIEYISEFNKYVLYIPDEWVNDHTELEKQIANKLKEHSITQVDVAILHGQFKYQLAGKKYTGFYFQEEYFLSLVKGFIHIGHYHVHSTFDRILATGSLERLAHGEEQPKGYILVNGNKYTFIENKNAYKYVTISVNKNTSLEKLDRQIYSYPAKSYIRLLLNKDHEFNIKFNEIKARYADYNLKKLVKDDISDDKSISYIINDTSIEMNDFERVNTDIYTLLVDSIRSKYTLSSDEDKLMLSYLDKLKLTGETNAEY